MTDRTDDAVEIALLRAEVDNLKAMVEKQNEQIAELVTAWKTAAGVVAFVKVVGGLAAAGLAILAFVKGFGK